MHQQNRLEKFLLNSSPPSLWSWTQVWIPGVLATQLPLIQVRPSQRRVNLPFSVWLQPPEIEPLFLLCCFLHCVFHERVCLSVCYPEVQLFHTLQTLVGRSLKAQVAANLLERNVSLQILIAKGCGRDQLLSWRILCDLLDCSPLGSSIRGSFQARILEWVAVSSSRELPDPGIKPTSPVSPALQANYLPVSY